MKRWGSNQQNETKGLRKSHLVLGIFAFIGFGMILISLAGPVFSTTPVPVGHDLSEVGDGTASGTASSVYTFPGTIFGNIIKIGTGAVAWELYSTAAFLGLRNNSAGNPTVLGITNAGFMGIGTTTPTQKLDVSGGQIHATGDICTDAGVPSNKCLSNLTKNKVMTNFGALNMVRVCSPASCSGNLGVSGNTTAPCPAGYTLISCGGGASVTSASDYLKQLIFTPLSTSAGDSSNGCRMDWGATSGSTVVGAAMALCAPVGT